MTAILFVFLYRRTEIQTKRNSSASATKKNSQLFRAVLLI